MKKIKGLMLIISMIFTIFACGIFTACANGNDNMQISLSVNHLDIILGENDNTASLRATVSDAVDFDLIPQYDSQDIRVTATYLGDGVTRIDVVAERKCQNVEVTLKGAKKNAMFTVSATLPISSITPKHNTYAISYDLNNGGSLDLSSSMFTIEPQGTDQTDLKFSLKTELNGISIQNNKVIMEKNLNTIPSEIVVEVVSVFNEEIKSQITLAVINAIDIQKIIICDEAGRVLEENPTRNLARNNQNSNSVVFQIRVPFSVANQELNVLPVFKYGDAGIRTNSSNIYEDRINSYYVYSFNFSLDSQNNRVSTDYIWFVLSYKNYPDTQFSTAERTNGTIAITTYDEIRNISITSEGTSVDTSIPLNIFTSYVAVSGKISGLALTFEAMPTTASSGKLSLNVRTDNVNSGFLMVKNSAGSQVSFTNGKYLFDSGETLYFSVANSGFAPGTSIDVIVLSEENNEIQKQLTFNFNEGISTLAFVNEINEVKTLETSRIYYLASQGELSNSKIKVALAPSSIGLDLATIEYSNEIFEISGPITEVEEFNGVKIYEIPVSAKTQGKGVIDISFESGQKITAEVNVIKELTAVDVKIEPTFNVSASVGNISYENNSIKYVAIKNGQNIPLQFVSDSDVLTTSFSFADKKYDALLDDLYDENSSYSLFGTEMLDDVMFGNISDVISAVYLRSSQLIAPVSVGKVVVKAMFTGKQIILSDNGKEYVYADKKIEKYFVIEVYNPIVSILLSEKNVELYAYDEVGEINSALSKKVITITLNKDTFAPTYGKIFLDGLTKIDDDNYKYSINSDVDNFIVTRLTDTQFEISALTRNDNGEESLGEDEFDSAVINLIVKDLNLEKNRLVSSLKVTLNVPTLVNKVTMTNKPASGLIYLQTKNLVNDISLNSFRILTKVTPDNALNKEVTYKFIPNDGVLGSIIEINEDGLIKTTGDVGGSGKILIIPKDCILLDSNGHESYKNGYESRIDSIDIVVSDGTTRETAIRISSLSEIEEKYSKNNTLHYVLTQSDLNWTGRLFDGTFSGGLYGKLIGSNNMSTIRVSELSLFEIIGLDAVVEDLYLVGSVINCEGMLANTNNGTIKNVVIDAYTLDGSEYITSKVENKQSGIAGGFVGVNNGDIISCTFSGKVYAKNEENGFVGGIAAINSGKIITSSVILYNLNENANIYSDENSPRMILSGNVVGGLVGCANSGSNVSTSYICDYTQINLLPQTAGGLVGKITSKNVVFEQCFAEIYDNLNFFKEKDDSLTDVNLKTILKNCYIVSKNADGVAFSAYMTNQSNGVLVKQNVTDASSESYPNISFGDIWNKDDIKNYGYPYLTAVQVNPALTTQELQNLTIQDSRLSLQEQDGVAVMFFYKAQDTITTSEQIALNEFNNISLIELFNTTKTNGLLISIPKKDINGNNNAQIITINGLNGIQIKGTGNCEIVISSKYDRSVPERRVNIVVLLYTSNFAFNYQGLTLNSGSQIGVRAHTNEVIQSSLTDEIVLFDKKVKLAVPNYIVNFESSNDASFVITGNTIGNHTIAFNEDELNLNAYLRLDGYPDYVNYIIRNNFNINIRLKKTYGTLGISTSISSLVVSPSDESEFYLSIISDEKYRNTLTESEYRSPLVLDSDNLPVYGVIDFVQVGGVYEIKDGVISGTIEAKYIIKVVISKTVRNFDQNGYKVIFATSDGLCSTQMNIFVLDQEILRVDINNYATMGTDTQDYVSANYYPNNVLSPGKSGILDIMVYPAYATYTHITVTSLPVLNNELRFTSQRKDGGLYKIDESTNFEFIENGLKIYAKDLQDAEIGRYYARVVVPNTVAVDTVYTIVVKVYNNEELKYTQEFSLIIVPQEIAGVSVDGRNSVFALRGETLTADIIVEQDQEIDFNGLCARSKNTNSILSDSEVNIKFNYDYVSYATKYKKGTLTITIGDTAESFNVVVPTYRYVNGVREDVISSTMVVYVIPFDVDMTQTHLVTEDSGDVIYGDRYFAHELDFSIGGIYIEKQSITSTSQRSFEKFINDKNFKNTSLGFYANYDINSKVQKGSPDCLKVDTWIENLYYVNGTNYTPVVTKNASGNYEQNSNASNIVDYIKPQTVLTEIEGEIVETRTGKLIFKGENNGSQEMLFLISFLMPDGNVYTHKYFFTIKISDPTSDDSPNSISSQSEFMAAFDNETEEDYILTKDLYLYDYSAPEDTSKIRSLDGNGYTIYLVNFADSNETILNYSLFKTISSNTTIKNLIVDVYHIGTIDVSDLNITEVNFAPVAIDNQGIITNTQVVSYRQLQNEIRPQISGVSVVANSTFGITANTSGFVLNNSGVITNSAVGGESVAHYYVDATSLTATNNPITLSPFIISSFGDVAGFVYSNSGHIVSSNVNNVRIINNSNTDYTTSTAGFVVSNNGYISMSYSKGVKQNASDIHASLFGIETSGISAGFVYKNSGEINNSYSNITLTNVGNNPGRNSAGFVYENTKNANISTSLSLSRIVGSTTTQMNFVGVDDKGNYLNKGSVDNSYYYDQIAMADSAISVESAYGNSASVVPSITNSEQLYGFSFSRSSNIDSIDGIWTMTTSGPELVSANIRSVSLRVASSDDNNIYAYVDQYRYGSKYNPILIRTAEEYNRVFSGTDNSSASKFVDVSSNKIFGNYRLINNIDMSELVDDSSESMYRLSSSKMTLTGEHQADGLSIGKFDGNGFTIKGLALSNTDAVSTNLNFGLFASVESNAIIMNLDVVLGTTNSEGDIFGVEAKNIQYVGAIAGSVKDSTVVNINLSSAYKNTNNVTVRGKNIVGGILGRVIGNSYVFNLTAKDISVSAVMYPENYLNDSSYNSYNTYNQSNRIIDSLNSTISYAGGIIGLLDYYVPSNLNNDTFSDSLNVNYGDVTMLKVTGVNQISAGTAGGVFGYVGSLSIVQDVLYELAKTEDNSQQGIYSYNGFAGGIVGLNKGYLRQVRSEHEYAWQIGEDDFVDDSIEDYIDDYYRTNDPDERNSIDRGNLELFYNQNYTPIAVGGIVGLEISGKIVKSYSKLNVISKNSKYAGGILGINTNTSNKEEIPFAMEEVYAMGDVKAKEDGVAGGVFGLEATLKSMVLNKVNAVNYWGYWLIEESHGVVYSFGNNVVDPKYCAQVKDIEFGTEVIDNNNCSNYNYYITEGNLQEVTPMKNITGIGDDGTLFDGFFFGNEWDPESWQRYENELFPHILFGYSNQVTLIKNIDDIELMRNSKQGDIFVIAPEEIYQPRSLEQWTYGSDGGVSEKWIVIDRPIIPIKNFKGTLKVADTKCKYGFKFTDKAGSNNGIPTNPLFKSSINASFSDFTIVFERNQTNVKKTSVVLVADAYDTKFNNVTFSGITINNNNDKNISIAVGTASGTTSFSNIKFENCSIVVDLKSEMNVGLLFAKGSFASDASGSTAVYNTIIDNNGASIIIKGSSNISEGSYNNSNIGLIGGFVEGSSSTKISTSGLSKTSIMWNGIIQNANIGYVVGMSSDVQFTGISDDQLQDGTETSSSEEYNNKILYPRILQYTTDPISEVEVISCNIGGVVGYAQKTTFDTINCEPQMYISSSTNSSVGGLVGTAESNSSIVNCNLYNNYNSSQSKALYSGTYNGYNFTKTVEDVSYSIVIMDCIDSNIGSFAGFFAGQVSGIESEGTESFANIFVRLNNTNENNFINIGGLFGKYQGFNDDSKLSYSTYHGNIDFVTNVKVNVNVNIGELIGVTDKFTNLDNCVTTGNIRFIVGDSINKENVTTEGGIDLVLSAMIAKSSEDIDLSNCISVGSIYPCAYIDANSKSYLNNNYAEGRSKLVLGKFTYGGLIGNAQKSIDIQRNKVIATLFNKYDRYIVEDYNTATSDKYFVNAFIGSISNGTVTGESNKYSHVYTLLTENNDKTNVLSDSSSASAQFIVENVKLSSLLPSIQNSWFTVAKNNRSRTGSSISHIYGEEGSKLNPKQSFNDIDKSNTSSLSYIYIESSNSIDVSDGNKNNKNLENVFLTSDGAVIKVNKLNISTGSSAPFVKIDKNSVVAGFVVYVNVKAEISTTANISGLANENYGIIYSCNIRGRSNDDIDALTTITGAMTIEATKSDISVRLAGMANINKGLIKESFTNLDIVLVNSGGKTLNVSAFVVDNQGIIDYCYASGSIDIDKLKNAENLSYFYDIFASKLDNSNNYQESNVFNSYSITKIISSELIEGDSSKLSVLLGDTILESYENKNNFVDILAIEVKLSESDEVLKTSYRSKSYFIENSNLKTLSGNFNYDLNNAYGYPSFTSNQYKSITYMSHLTGDGSKEKPYQIPNLGKLQQIENGSDVTDRKYFTLTYDMNGSQINSLLDWNSFNIENIEITSIDYKTLSNINTEGGGLFNEITNSTIKKFKLKAIKPITFAKHKIEYLGILANIAKTDNNASEDETTKIFDITIISTENSDFIEQIENAGYNDFVVGSIVGQLDNAVLSNCELSQKATNTTESLSENSYKINLSKKQYLNSDNAILPSTQYIIGGLVGEATNSAVIEDVLMSNAISVQLSNAHGDWTRDDKDIYYCFIIGGIVGNIKNGAKVKSTSISGSLNILTETENIKFDGNNVYLFVGGVVGVAGEIRGGLERIYNIETDYDKPENEKTKIETSYVDAGVTMYAGNHSFINETYLGGISAYGGSIKNCYNNGKVLSSKAMYARISDNYDPNSSQGSVHGGSSAYMVSVGDSANVYVNESLTDFAAFNKLVYVRVKELAYSAGIANNAKIEQSVNYCEEIKGGLDARQIYSYIQTDTSKFAQRLAWSKVVILGGIVAFRVAFKIPAGTYGGLPWGYLIKAGVLAGIVGAIVVGVEMVIGQGIDVKLWYFSDSMYKTFGASTPNVEVINDGIFKGQDKLIGKESNQFWTFLYATLNIAESTYTGGIWGFLTQLIGLPSSTSNYTAYAFIGYFSNLNGKGYGTKFPFGHPNYVVKNSSFIKDFEANLNYVSRNEGTKYWMGLTHITAKNGNKLQHSLYTANDILRVFERYSDPIGNNIVQNGTIYSAASAFSKVTISDNNFRYAVPDNEDFYKNDYGSTQNTSLSTHYGMLYYVDNVKDILDPNNIVNDDGSGFINTDTILGWTDEDGTPLWMEDGGIVITTNSNSVKHADLDTLFAQDEEGNSKMNLGENDDSEVKIVINNLEDYNAVRMLISELPRMEVNNTVYDWKNVDYSINDVANIPDEIKSAINTYTSKLFGGPNSEYMLHLFKLLGKIANGVFISITITPHDGEQYTSSFNFKNTGSPISIEANYPFNGEFIGASKVANKSSTVTLQNIKFSSSSVAQYGLFGYVSNLNVSNFEFNYSNEQSIQNDELTKNVSFGGIIANAVGGDIQITNTTINLILKDYVGTSDNYDNESSKAFTIGGIVGYSNNSNVYLYRTSVNTNISLRNYDDALNENIGVGGVVGYAENCSVSVGMKKLEEGETVNTTTDTIKDFAIIIDSKSANGIAGGIIGVAKDTDLDIRNITITKNSSILAHSSVNDSKSISGGLVGLYNYGNLSVQNTSMFANVDAASHFSSGVTSYAGGLVGMYLPINNTNYTFTIVHSDNSEIKVVVGNYYKLANDRNFVKAGLSGTSYSKEAHAGDVFGNFNISESDLEKLTINVKSLAFANPNYKADVYEFLNPSKNTGDMKPTIESKEILFADITTNDYNETQANQSNMVKTMVTEGIMVTKYEYALEVSTSGEFAYINGEKFALYNYQKVIYIIVTKLSLDQDEDGNDGYSHYENIYRITISGMMNDKGDYDITENCIMQYIGRIKYFSGDIFKLVSSYKSNKYKDLSTIETQNSNSKYKGFLRGLRDLSLEQRDDKFYPTGYSIIKDENQSIFYSGYVVDSIDFDGVVYYRAESPAKEILETTVYEPDENYDIRKDAKTPYRGYDKLKLEQGSLVLDYQIYRTYDEIIDYSYIYQNSINLYPGMTNDTLISSNVATDGITLESISSNAHNVANNTVSMNVNGIDSSINITDIIASSSENSNFINVRQINNNYISNAIRTYQYKLGTKNIVIVSTIQKLDNGNYQYVDYVFNVTGSKVYYLGNVEYTIEGEVIVDGANRNRLFFPEELETAGYDIANYKNNLYSIDLSNSDIQIFDVDNSSCEVENDLIKLNIDVVKENNYEFNFVDNKIANNQKMQSYELTVTKFKFDGADQIVTVYYDLQDITGGDQKIVPNGYDQQLIVKHSNESEEQEKYEIKSPDEVKYSSSRQLKGITREMLNNAKIVTFTYPFTHNEIPTDAYIYIFNYEDSQFNGFDIMQLSDTESDYAVKVDGKWYYLSIIGTEGENLDIPSISQYDINGDPKEILSIDLPDGIKLYYYYTGNKTKLKYTYNNVEQIVENLYGHWTLSLTGNLLTITENSINSQYLLHWNNGEFTVISYNYTSTLNDNANNISYTYNIIEQYATTGDKPAGLYIENNSKEISFGNVGTVSFVDVGTPVNLITVEAQEENCNVDVIKVKLANEQIEYYDFDLTKIVLKEVNNYDNGVLVWKVKIYVYGDLTQITQDTKINIYVSNSSSYRLIISNKYIVESMLDFNDYSVYELTNTQIVGSASKTIVLLFKNAGGNAKVEFDIETGKPLIGTDTIDNIEIEGESGTASATIYKYGPRSNQTSKIVVYIGTIENTIGIINMNYSADSDEDEFTLFYLDGINYALCVNHYDVNTDYTKYYYTMNGEIITMNRHEFWNLSSYTSFGKQGSGYLVYNNASYTNSSGEDIVVKVYIYSNSNSAIGKVDPSGHYRIQSGELNDTATISRTYNSNTSVLVDTILYDNTYESVFVYEENGELVYEYMYEDDDGNIHKVTLHKYIDDDGNVKYKNDNGDIVNYDQSEIYPKEIQSNTLLEQTYEYKFDNSPQVTAFNVNGYINIVEDEVLYNITSGANSQVKRSYIMIDGVIIDFAYGIQI